ncbi:Crp/Fnr family transcriptional regulator [Listeria booriae]|uniref:Crp/Fnr family transcriptional regulator n=1 Tax=Listeria booriae TaxID=1552123 RepID=A0A7X0XVE1_9LIST|nr:Crp/Fnr family transcriptional regulator [Listeria booriae]MBC1792495.1 Crp/Fnr family transcriptional regulator [Listeria booriae]MBC1801972.1 Crp/Fnr family transcriptional regulator [Listeria booriae]MBC1813864.1 Crp/Fnr family transcriptional regulator [Listeria booriae]MBC1898301.1 Crp/Fnr family transcriptional regulator [Listeria booriae]MBC2324750.1 Crp/Fnr family transcriptional regulator [Listeria booriae]
MYDKDELRSFASFATILKILKRDPNFNKYCTQHRVPKGSIITLNPERKDSYLLESGYVKYDYTGKSSEGYYYVIPAGRFISLPVVKNQFTLYAQVTALTELIWWKIDVEFLKKMLQLEDPRNYVMLNYSIEVAYKMYIISKKYLLSAENRVYFALLRCAEVGIKVADNQVELPTFITYDLLAEFAGISKGYTSTVLGELRDNGVLISSKKPWVITDLTWLNNILKLEGLGYIN